MTHHPEELSELTTKTKPRSTVEGHVAPADIRQFGTFPSFGSEIVGVVAIEVFPSVEIVRHDPHAHVSGHEYGVFAGWSAATG